jgi:hypothetical protein
MNTSACFILNTDFMCVGKTGSWQSIHDGNTDQYFVFNKKELVLGHLSTVYEFLSIICASSEFINDITLSMHPQFKYSLPLT